jgi:hypothetical protein
MSRLTLLSLLPLTLCFGCLASLLTIDTPTIKTAELEKVEQEIDAYFAQTSQVYSNAEATVTALSNSQSTFRLTAADYQAMIASVVGDQPFVMPKHLNAEESAALFDVVTQSKKLQHAVMHSAENSVQAARFLASKTKDLEQELVTLRSQHEMIKRNPLASRRDKGRAANKIRKANKLGESIKSKAIKQHKDLAQLQKTTLTGLKSWALTLKGAGNTEANNALSGIRDQKNSMVDAQRKDLENTATKAAQSTIDGVSSDMEAGSRLVEGAASAVQAKKAAADGQLNQLKAKADAELNVGTRLLEGAASTVQDKEAALNGQVNQLRKKAVTQSKTAKEGAQNVVKETEASAKAALDDSLDDEAESSDEDE